MGVKGYKGYYTAGHRGLDISKGSVLLFAAPPCTMSDLANGLTPDGKRARITTPVWFEVVIQSTFQKKFSYTTTVRGLLNGG